MDEMKWYLLCLIVLPAIFLGTEDTVNGTVTVIKNSVVAVINDSTFFNCSTSSDEVEWHFGSNQYPEPIIYSYGEIKQPYNDRFRIENYTYSFWKQFNLILLSVTEKDAGLYICRNPDRLDEKGMTVHLTVLDAGPTCAANWSAEGVIGPNSCGIEPETIQLSCSVRYTGNKAPTLTIRKLGEDVSIKTPSVVCSESGHTSMCNLTMDSDLQMDGVSYVCQTNESTTNQYSCTSEALRIICGAELNIALIVGLLTVGLLIAICLILLIIWMYKKGYIPIRRITVQETDDGIEMEPRPSSTGNIEDRHDTDDETGNRLLSPGAQNFEDPDEESRAMENESGEPSTANAALLEATVEVNENPSPAVGGNPYESFFNADIELVEINGVTFEVITPAEAKSERESRIRGITLLNQQLFIATDSCKKIEVYDTISKTFMKPLYFESLLEPGTMASCIRDNCIYLIDKKYLRDKVEIFKFSPDGELLTKWSNDDAYGRLSVIENTGDLVLTVYETDHKPMLKIFSAEGKLINTIKFTEKSNIRHSWHAVKLSQSGFVVGHGSSYNSYNKPLLHRLCKIDEDGNLLKSFGGEIGSGIDSLNDPSCVIETANESILVADMNNHRVLLLSKDLEFKKVLFAEEYRIKFPEALYFDEKNNRLYVACNLEKVRHGRVICLPCTIN